MILIYLMRDNMTVLLMIHNYLNLKMKMIDKHYKKIISQNLGEIHSIIIRINNNKYNKIKNKINHHLIILIIVLIQ